MFSRSVSLSLPAIEAERLSAAAAERDLDLAEFLGVMVVVGAFGLLHPYVVEYRRRHEKLDLLELLRQARDGRPYVDSV